jgi:outer membrane lipoprotein SlyB
MKPMVMAGVGTVALAGLVVVGSAVGSYYASADARPTRTVDASRLDAVASSEPLLATALTPATAYAAAPERNFRPAVETYSAPVHTYSAPVRTRSAAPTASRRTVSREPVSGGSDEPQVHRRTRSWQSSALIIGGSTVGGAVLGGVVGGKKGAVIGGVVGGAAGTIYDRTTRHKQLNLF